MNGKPTHGNRSLKTNRSDETKDRSEETLFNETASDHSQEGNNDTRSASKRSSDKTSSEEHSPSERATTTLANKQPLRADEVYCFSCGSPIKEQAEICPHCGVRQRPPPTPPTTTSNRKRSPTLTAIASMLWTGAGQIYNGQLIKGLVLMGILVTAGVGLFGIAVVGSPAFSILPLVAMPLVWFCSVLDAYRTATRLNDRRQQIRS